jgi:EAL domain-containing protein (putative c-di-GMP-specific phosphodiesterase class I)
MGKSLQPLNAMAVRPPANTSAAAPAGAEPVTAESLGWQLRAALPPLRLHSVSLYDEEANVLWLSEGALGPDEHSLVLEAMDTLANDRSMACCENGLEDGRVAIFLPVRAPQGELVGVAMILADLKSVGDGVLERIVSPQVRTIMQRVAVLLRANGRGAPAAEPPAPIPVSIASVVEFTPERAPTSPRPATPASQAAPQPAPAPTAPPHAAARPPGAPTKPVVNTRPTVAAPAPSSGVASTPVAPPQVPPAAAATAAPAARASASSVAPAPAVRTASPASGGDPELSPQAVDDILEFEIFPDVAAAAPARPAGHLSAIPQPPTLEWDNPVATAGLSASPVAEAQTTPEAPSPIVVPSATVSSLSGGNIDSLATTTEVALELHSASPPVLSPPASPSPVISAATPASAPVVKSTNTTTTTTRAITPPAANGTHQALNGTGATSTVQTLNVAGTGSSRVLALDPSSIILDIQAFSKLRAGGRARRYEVLPRMPHRDANRAPAAVDGLALQRLLSWLSANRSAWSMEPTSFSLNLSISTLEDPRFPQHVASCLKANGIAPDNLGFEIAEALCTQHRAQVERFMSLCDKLGCFVVIDDFSLDSSVFPLLRSKALRLVKIDPKLTSAALRDKLSQAMVVAIVQAVKVLGIHCAAKRVESQATLQWLTGIGCDLAQGPALCQVLPIESLNMPQTPATEPTKLG